MRLTVTTLTAVAVVVMGVQVAAASPAQASCPEGQLEDPTTRMCWSQDGEGSAFYTSDGGPCIPGQVGNCVGQIRASPLEDPVPDLSDEADDAWGDDKGGHGGK